MSAAALWLDACLARLKEARVAVFGDFCIDAYWHLDPDTSELSVETGLPVRRVREQRYGLGGAGNVAANLVDLGVGSVRVVGLIGGDLFSRLMLELMTARGIAAGGMLRRRDDWQTMVYAKPCVGDTEESRIDFGAFNEINAAAIKGLGAELDRAAAECDAIILNQQVPAGVSTAGMIRRINDVVASHADCVFLVDSRHRAGQYRGALLKLNAHEAARLCGETRPIDGPVAGDDARRFAEMLYARSGEPVLITRGKSGIVVGDSNGVHDVPAVPVEGAIDPVGAGDTAIAALAAVMASGGSALEAARLAVLAAAVTVCKLQTTGTATPGEIRQVAHRSGVSG